MQIGAAKKQRRPAVKISAIQGIAILSGTILSLIHATEFGIDLGDTRPQFILYSISAILLIVYIVTGPMQSELQEQQLLSQNSVY